MRLEIAVTGTRRAVMIAAQRACILTAASLACAVTTHAQPTRPDGLPEPLRSIKPADGICPRDDVVTTSGAPAAPPLPEPDLSCAVSPAEAVVWLDQPETLFVDTREPADYTQFSIRGSANIKPSELQYKSFLKRKRLVLLGTGKGEQELYRSCAVLKRQGFTQVRVLRGGIALWHAAQQPLVGRPPPTALLARLDVVELFLETQFGDHVVLVTSSRSNLQPSLPFSTAISQTTADAIRAVLERRRKELKGAPFASVILIAGPELTDQQFEQLQNALKPVPLLLYSDTKEAFDVQLARQTAIWAAQARGPKKPPCGT